MWARRIVPYLNPRSRPRCLRRVPKSTSSTQTSFSLNPPIESKSLLKHQNIPALTRCHRTKGKTTMRLHAIPKDHRSGTILTPPPMYRRVLSVRTTSTSMFRDITLSASIVTIISPVAAETPAFRILLKLRASSRTMRQPNETAISSVRSLHRFRTTMCSKSIAACFADSNTEETHAAICLSSL